MRDDDHRFYAGTRVRLVVSTASVEHPDRVADPTSLEVVLLRPDEDDSTHLWPGGSIARTSMGRFSLDVVADVPGTWRWKVTASGAVSAPAFGQFDVIEAPW